MLPIKEATSMYLLDGNAESTKEHPQKSRMTLMSPKEFEIFRCIPNQLEMPPDSRVLDLEHSPVPYHTRQVACLIVGNSRDSLSDPSQV